MPASSTSKFRRGGGRDPSSEKLDLIEQAFSAIIVEVAFGKLTRIWLAFVAVTPEICVHSQALVNSSRATGSWDLVFSILARLVELSWKFGRASLLVRPPVHGVSNGAILFEIESN
jgi:hypothetical protein